MEERLLQEFKKYDPENTGFISSEKLKILLYTENPSITEEQFNEQLSIYDTNGDGQIDFEEFKAMNKGSK